MTVDNLVGMTIGAGPGFVARFGRESSDPLAPAGPTPVALKPAPAGKEVNKYTLVKFQGRMFSVVKDKEKTRNSKFYDDVEVYHQPSDVPRPAINPTTVPKDGFQSKCSLLSIYTRPVAGKSCQYMLAERRVTFRTDEFHGNSDIVKFDEADDIVIFEASPGNTVTITKFKGQIGPQGQQIQGKKILYQPQNRRIPDRRRQRNPGPAGEEGEMRLRPSFQAGPGIPPESPCRGGSDPRNAQLPHCQEGSKVRTPPAAFTCTWGGESRRIKRKSSSVAPVAP